MKWYLTPTAEELGPYGKELFLNYPSTIKFFYLKNEEPKEKIYILDVSLVSSRGSFMHNFDFNNIHKKYDSFNITWFDSVIAEWDLDDLISKISKELDCRQKHLLSSDYNSYEGLHAEFKLHLTKETLREDIRSWIPKF